jgi:predicted nucleic acid-binding protein
VGRRVLIDTAILIHQERGTLPDGLLFADDDVAVAALTLAEYAVGVERAKTSQQKARRREILEGVRQRMAVEEYTASTAEFHARLMAHTIANGMQRGAHDLIIAAHAAQSGRLLVSTDYRARFADLPGVNSG